MNVPGMHHIRYASERGEGLRSLPALARDLGASATVLAALALAAALPQFAVPASTLVLLPVLLLTAVAFGRDSAFLAALLAALLARLAPFGAAEGWVGLLTIAALSGGALATAALVEELRRSRASAETAHLRSDSTARRAAERVEEARSEVREAQTRLVEAERKAQQAGHNLRASARSGAPDPALDSAFRSEGGI